MKNEYKEQLQRKELEVLKDKHRVVLRWATGCGKSKMTIDLLNCILNEYRFGVLHDTPIDVLFVVAERAHIENWRDEFRKWKLNDLINVKIICYASLKNYQWASYAAIVFDEAHHCFTEKRMAVIETMSADYVYLLSATLSTGKIEEMEKIYGEFTTSTVTLKDAISSDILPDPRVYVIQLELDDTRANQEIVIGNAKKGAPVVKWSDRDKYVYRNTPCFIKCTQKQKYIFMTTKMEYWKRRYQMTHNEFHKNQWVSLGSQRKRYIGELKTPYVKRLISKLSQHKRYVCFCTSVDQASEISHSTAISSRKSSKQNQAIIDAFNKKKINEIYAVGMITEGMNLNGIEAGIIVQLDGKERLFVQKYGRLCRAEDPICYIFYYKNTQDEFYLKSALENIDPKFIKWCKAEDL